MPWVGVVKSVRMVRTGRYSEESNSKISLYKGMGYKRKKEVKNECQIFMLRTGRM